MSEKDKYIRAKHFRDASNYSMAGNIGTYSPAGGSLGRWDREDFLPINSCKSFIVPPGHEVQINVVAYMYYKGKRISKVIESYRKELHPKITQELHALNIGLEGTNHYAYVSICSPRDTR